MITSFIVVLPARGEPAEVDNPFTLGVCTHFVQRKGLLEENLRLIREAGVQSIRDEVPWAQVEKEQGVLVVPQRVDDYVNAALAQGLEVMLVLDYGNKFYEKGKKPKEQASIDGFTRYADFIVTHFKGRVRQFEMWNEWNIGIGTATQEAGTPEDYLKLIQTVYPTLKTKHPEVEFIGGVVAPKAFRDGFWEKALELGLLKNCDAVSVHTYNYAAQQAEGRTAEAWFALMEKIVGQVRDAGGTETPIYVTEHGWPTHQGAASTPPPRAADYLSRSLLLLRTLPQVRGFWWYDFQDDGWKPGYNEDNFGLVRPDLTPKPGYFALAQVAPLLQLGQASLEKLSESTHVVRFPQQNDGMRAVAMWSTAGSVRATVTPGDAKSGDATLTWVGRPTLRRAWQSRDWVMKPEAPVVEAIDLSLSATPVLLQSATETTVSLTVVAPDPEPGDADAAPAARTGVEEP